MDIEEFIQTTLTQIIDGVKKAQDAGVKKAQDAGVKRAQDATRLQGGPEEDVDMVNPRVMYSATPAPKGTHLRHG